MSDTTTTSVVDANDFALMKNYDPNEGRQPTGAMLPSGLASAGLDAYVNLADRVLSGEAPAGTYLERVITGFHKAIVDKFTGMRKSIDVPSQFLSFARMSYMPDTTDSNILPWPGVDPDALRKIVMENLAPNLIIGMRVDDVLQYSQPSKHVWRPGWRLEMFQGDKTPSAEDRKMMREAEKFLSNSSMNIGYSETMKRDEANLSGFQKFLAALTRDTLIYDLIAISVDRDTGSRVVDYGLIPAGNIRYVGTEGYEGKKDVFAVMVDEGGTVKKTYTRKDLITYVRNPRTDPEWSITMTRGYGTPEIQTALKLVALFQNVIEFNSDVFQRCYSEDTEVLTRAGWKFFNDVDIDIDEFATLNLETSEFEYQKATDRVWNKYVGDMYHLHSRSLDFLVTPKHRVIMQYRPSPGSPYEVSYAEDLYQRFEKMSDKSRDNYALPAVSRWVGAEVPEQAFDCGPKRFYAEPRHITGDDYCAFMGMYLAEGNLFRDDPESPLYNIAIHQRSYSRGFVPYKTLLTRIFGKDITYFEAAGRFNFGWWGLAEHLAQFGHGCENYQIPQVILKATPRQQKIFWDYYLLGDGTTTPTGHERIVTTSRAIADQLQELVQKMGFAATINTVDPNKYPRSINGVVVKSSKLRYTVCKKTSPMQGMRMEKVHYEGRIGCVTVPNGTLYVRRGGKAIWSGNSGVPHGMLLLTGNGWTQRQVDVLTRIWNNLKKGISKAVALPVLAAPKDGKVEVIDFSRIKGDEALYQDLLNLSIGCFCAVYRFPPHRLGYRISGKGPDTKRDGHDTPGQLVDDEDTGRVALLVHIETLINDNLIAPRWPSIRFRFTAKEPKADAREYEARKNAQTWAEARAEADLPDLMEHPLVKKNPKLKELMEVMQVAPIDPNMSGVYQSVAAAWLKGEAREGEDIGFGNNMTSTKDPAKAELHGKVSGVRRDSAAEGGSSTH